MLLPIDSKFPREDYDHLRKRLRLVTPNWPPHTLEFAILFIPTESLYAEVLRQPGLLEQLQRDYRVMIAGPTNLAALLTSLGRRASSVWCHYRKFEASAKGRSGSYAVQETRNRRQFHCSLQIGGGRCGGAE